MMVGADEAMLCEEADDGGVVARLGEGAEKGKGMTQRAQRRSTEFTEKSKRETERSKGITQRAQRRSTEFTEKSKGETEKGKGIVQRAQRREQGVRGGKKNGAEAPIFPGYSCRS